VFRTVLNQCWLALLWIIWDLHFWFNKLRLGLLKIILMLEQMVVLCFIKCQCYSTLLERLLIISGVMKDHSSLIPFNTNTCGGSQPLTELSWRHLSDNLANWPKKVNSRKHLWDADVICNCREYTHYIFTCF
jgi:hypothetical protein